MIKASDLHEPLLPKLLLLQKSKTPLSYPNIEIVKKLKLTHAQVAKLAGTSRTRITALLNRNTQDISADLMLRILASLGYRAKLSVSKAA